MAYLHFDAELSREIFSFNEHRFAINGESWGTLRGFNEKRNNNMK